MKLSRRSMIGLAFTIAAMTASAVSAQESLLKRLLGGDGDEAVAPIVEDPGAQTPEEAAAAPGPLHPGLVNAAILTYGNGKTSRCFSNEFLSQVSRETNISCNPDRKSVV